MIDLQRGAVEVPNERGRAVVNNMIRGLSANPYQVLELSDEGADDPGAYVVSPELLKYLLYAEEAYSKAASDPNYQALQAELLRRTRVARGLLAELKSVQGQEEKISENLLNILLKNRPVSGLVSPDGLQGLDESLGVDDPLTSAFSNAKKVSL
jgi:hypothetical protein